MSGLTNPLVYECCMFGITNIPNNARAPKMFSFCFHFDKFVSHFHQQNNLKPLVIRKKRERSMRTYIQNSTKTFFVCIEKESKEST